MTLSTRFVEAFDRISEKEVKRKYVMRYILDKLAQFIDMGANQIKEERLKAYKEKYEIEHIHPQDPSDEAKEEFGECSDDVIGRLGNLTLLEKPLNRHLKNSAFSKKKTVYIKSNTLLTRTIAEKVQVGKSSITRAVADLETYNEWNRNCVEQRQKMLAELAHKVWNVEKPKQSLQRELTDPPALKERSTQSNTPDSAPTQIKVFDKTITVQSWRDAMVKFLIAVYEHDPEALYSLVDKEQREPKIRKSPSPHKTHISAKIGDSGLWINKHGSGPAIKKKCREIERLLGHNENSILIFLSGDRPHQTQS